LTGLRKFRISLQNQLETGGVPKPESAAAVDNCQILPGGHDLQGAYCRKVVAGFGRWHGNKTPKRGERFRMAAMRFIVRRGSFYRFWKGGSRNSGGAEVSLRSKAKRLRKNTRRCRRAGARVA